MYESFNSLEETPDQQKPISKPKDECHVTIMFAVPVVKLSLSHRMVHSMILIQYMTVLQLDTTQF